MTTLVFFDVEFTDLVEGNKPISLGFVADDGREFYAELGGYDIWECSDFVQDNVLPLLAGQERLTPPLFGKAFSAWLPADRAEVTLVCDNGWDIHHLTELFGGAFAFRKALPGVCCVKMQNLIPADHHEAVWQGCEDYFTMHPTARPHHALDDARALRQAFSGVSGYLSVQQGEEVIQSGVRSPLPCSLEP